jgi:AbiV family abortive infection protein
MRLERSPEHRRYGSAAGFVNPAAQALGDVQRGISLQKVANDPGQPPSWPALHEFWQAAEANAQDLISDAEALLAMRRWPRAFALAVLAHEEFGKGLMALALAATPPHVVAQERLRELTGGQLRALLTAYAREALAGRSELWNDALGSLEIARDADQRIQRGFRVDFADDGSLRLPSQIGEDEARALVARVRQIINSPGWSGMPFWLPPAAYPRPDDQG